MQVCSEALKRSQERCAEYEKALLATDARFRRWVYLVLVDGTAIMRANSFISMDHDDDNFIWVISEHYDSLVISEDEIYAGHEMLVCSNILDFYKKD